MAALRGGSKEVRALIRKVRAAGLTVEMRGSGHIGCLDGDRLVAVFPASSSDWRSVKNTLADLKRRGYDCG